MVRDVRHEQFPVTSVISGCDFKPRERNAGVLLQGSGDFAFQSELTPATREADEHHRSIGIGQFEDAQIALQAPQDFINWYPVFSQPHGHVLPPIIVYPAIRVGDPRETPWASPQRRCWRTPTRIIHRKQFRSPPPPPVH